MKTDLQKVLSISGEQGLFTYISQARTGMIAESLLTKKRSVFGHTAKVSSLSDIAIYTEEGEMPLKEVFEKIKNGIQVKKDYFQRFYECEGKTEHDEDLNKATQLAFDDAIKVIERVAEEYSVSRTTVYNTVRKHRGLFPD